MPASTEPMAEDVKALVLWVSGYYDGALDGVAMVERDGSYEVCWFALDNDAEGRAYANIVPRRYSLYELSDEQARQHLTDHLLFEHFVGTQACQHAGLNLSTGKLQPQGRWGGFYRSKVHTSEPHGHRIGRACFIAELPAPEWLKAKPAEHH